MSDLFETVGGWATVIAVLVAIIAIGVAVFIYFRQETLRTIDWFGIELSALLVRPVRDVAEGLALTWNGVPLQRPFTCTVRITNTGTEAITADQYKKSPTLTFTDAVCYDARVTRRSADNEIAEGLVLMTGAPSETFELPVVTQERGEWYEVLMVCGGRRRYPEFQARFLNQTRPPANGFRTGGKARVRIAQLLTVMSVVCFAIGAALGGTRDANPSTTGQIFLLIGTVGFPAASSFLIWSSFQRRNVNERNEHQIHPFLADD